MLGKMNHKQAWKSLMQNIMQQLGNIGPTSSVLRNSEPAHLEDHTGVKTLLLILVFPTFDASNEP